ncbi:MAG: hypothetical protein E6R03_09685 [Hyphomicrobiaceae bacterium]|nr:MAG: hypothetical protein E6R03_09685 [Hyphomicrobiaceae bacterium]
MTVLSTTIEEAWLANIWEHSTILNMTPRVYQYDVSVESEFDFDLLCSDGVVNFFLAKTQRRADPQLMNQTRYTFTVEVSYYLQQADIAENTYRTVRDRLETMDDLVSTSLGSSWDSTVDFYQGGVPSAIREVTIGEKKCWFSAITYTAFKTT